MKINEINAKVTNLAKKLVFQENTTRTLIKNILAEQNTILYGKGGYGKSQVAKEVCNELEVPYVTVQCYRDMPIEAFVGSLDMTEFTENSNYKTNFKDSPFMTPGVLILEEFMDVRPDITSVIKDIIQEKGYRYKDQFTPYETKAIIVTGNTSPAQTAVTDSSRALYYDRFISHIEVKWDKTGPNEYMELFLTEYNKMSLDLMFVAQLSSQLEISPRAALQVAAMVIAYPDDILNTLSGLHVFTDLDINNLYRLHNERIEQQDRESVRESWNITDILIKSVEGDNILHGE